VSYLMHWRPMSASAECSVLATLDFRFLCPAHGSHLLLVTLSTALVFDLPRRILSSRDFLPNSQWDGSSWRHMAVILYIISAIWIRSHHHAVQEFTYCSKTEAIMSAIMSSLCQLQGKAETIHQNVLPPFLRCLYFPRSYRQQRRFI
jgi:hypothetical protein